MSGKVSRKGARRLVRSAPIAALVSAIAVSSAAGSPAAAAQVTNGHIAFSVQSGIATMNADGSGQWSVPGSDGYAEAAWAPDGTRLAAVARKPGSNGIVVMRPDGSGASQITGSAGDDDPAWSPDGRRIAFASNGQLVAIDPDGSGRVQLTARELWRTSPSWSPDGSKLVFEGSGDIWILDVASGTETPLIVDPGWDSSPAWSPDGRLIAFAGYREGPLEVYVVRPDGTGLHSLTEGGYDTEPAWAPDASQVAFTRNGQIWVVNADGSGAHALAGGSWTSSPAWQPLGARPGDCTLWGTVANDLLVGTEGRDWVCGLGGNDTLIGLDGLDELRGGAGNDWIAGGQGSDLLIGDEGKDRLDARDGGGDFITAYEPGDLALVDQGRDVVVGRGRVRQGRNLAAWRSVIASAYEPSDPPVRAVDGRIDDAWESGAYPSQWIEIDLGREVDISRIRLIAAEQPRDVVYLVLARKPSGVYHELHRFDGPTAQLQELVDAPRHAWRRVRQLRILTGGSYPAALVAWPEIEVYGTPR